MQYSIILLIITICLLGRPQLSMADVDLDDLLRPPKAEQIEISPDGKKIAVVSREEGKRVLALMTLDPLEITYVLRLIDGQEVGDFYWVNNDRVVTTVWRSYGWMDTPTVSGALYALNYDGKRLKTVFGFEVGYRSEDTTARLKRQEIQTAHAAIISTVPNDKSHILISTYPWEVKGAYWRFTGETIGEVMKLNVYNGRAKKLMSLPSRGGRAFPGYRVSMESTSRDGDIAIVAVSGAPSRRARLLYGRRQQGTLQRATRFSGQAHR